MAEPAVLAAPFQRGVELADAGLDDPERGFGGAGVQPAELDLTGTADEATALLASKSYDAVLVDLRLSPAEPFEGFIVVAQARRCQPDCTIIVLSAQGTEDVRAAALAHGADAFVDKPTRLKVLEDLLEDLTSR